MSNAFWQVWLGQSANSNPVGSGADASINSNVLKQSYINRFLDVSGTLTVRYDASINGNLYLGAGTKFGLGVGAPTYTLDQSGTHRIQCPNSGVATTKPDANPGNNGLVLTSTKASGGTNFSMGLGIDYTTGNGYLNMGYNSGTSSAQPFVLQATGGDVGIGTTTPTAALYVVGNQNINGTVTGAGGSNYNAGAFYTGGNTVASFVNAVTINSGVTNAAVVEIGSLNRDILSSAAANVTYKYALAYHTNTTGGDFEIKAIPSGATYSADGTPVSRMYITASGNIGMGTVRPQYNLDVSGSARFTSDVSINGNLVVGGALSVQQMQSRNIINTTTTNYQLIVSEDLSLNGRLFVSGDLATNGGYYSPQYTLAIATAGTTYYRIGYVGSTYMQQVLTTEAAGQVGHIRITVDSTSWVGSNLENVPIQITTSMSSSYTCIIQNVYVVYSNTAPNNQTNGELWIKVVSGGGGQTIFQSWNSKSTVGHSANMGVAIGNASSTTMPPTGFSIKATYPINYTAGSGGATGFVGQNVGIGTTSPAYKLDLRASNLFATNAANISQTMIIAGDYGSSGYVGTAGAYLQGGTIYNVSTFLALGTCSGVQASSLSERMRIVDTGYVGIGTTNPAYPLDVGGQIRSFGFRPGLYMYNTYNGLNSTSYIWIDVNNTMTFNCCGFDKMYIRPDAGVLLDNFTGQHRTFIKDITFSQINPYIGLIVVANQNKYIGMESKVKTGLNAITINESLPVCSLCKKEKDKSCFGVISGAEDENKRGVNIGTGVFFPTEKEAGDTRIHINSLGEGAIWVSNKNGNLESGDYITSSTIPGYGTKQDSEFLCNYTVAKITMDCNFNPVYQASQTILKDTSGNNILDSNGEIQWADELDGSGNIIYEYSYKVRYILPDGTIITKEEYDVKKANNESVYISAFVGCTYHCG